MKLKEAFKIALKDFRGDKHGLIPALRTFKNCLRRYLAPKKGIITIILVMASFFVYFTYNGLAEFIKKNLYGIGLESLIFSLIIGTLSYFSLTRFINGKFSNKDLGILVSLIIAITAIIALAK